jgi:hypothetical protein
VTTQAMETSRSYSTSSVTRLLSAGAYLESRFRRRVIHELVECDFRFVVRRFAMGTVALLALEGRRVFAFVHCRQDLDLVTSSSATEFRHALERLWDSVRKHGLLRPVAMPLVGSGLARVALSRDELMLMIIDTFLKSCAADRCTPELRIVLRPAELQLVRISDIARFVEALDKEGNPRPRDRLR